MYYNLSEFITLIKEDIGIMDIVLPVDDNAIVERFIYSALKEFSVRYPNKIECWLTQCDALNENTMQYNASRTYIIPKAAYDGYTILAVLGILPGGYGSAANMYMPNVALGSADMILESVADIKMAASIGSMMCHSPTIEFNMPNRLTIYNGWTTASFRVELAVSHDPSLSTIPPGAFTHLRQLAKLDIEEFLYNKMKRQTNLEVGIGTISLQIDNWEGSGQAKQDLLKEWDETVIFDIDRINYW